MKDNLSALRNTSAAFFILCVSCLTLLGQGQLPPPPGPPGPTMKTLDQVEARIPIDAAHTPGDANSDFIISQPGSYYLTGNLGLTKPFGISITAPGVTLDLNGFRVLGSGTVTGVYISADNCTVRNGSIRGCGIGLNAVNTSGGMASHLSVSDCKTEGIWAGTNWQIVDSVSHNNGDDGFIAKANCTLTRCTAFNNVGDGIAAGSFCGLFSCNVSHNSSGNSNAFGIRVGDGSTLVDCVASANVTGLSPTASSGGGITASTGSTIKYCIAENNSGDGIQAGPNSTLIGCTSTGNGSGTIGSGIATDIRATISGCTAIGNKGDGIVFSGDSFVLNNHASTNGGAGFHDVGSASRIDGNVSRENTGIGILAASIDTVVRNNSIANGNSAANNQYGPTAGPNWGPVTTAASTNPWANF